MIDLQKKSLPPAAIVNGWGKVTVACSAVLRKGAVLPEWLPAFPPPPAGRRGAVCETMETDGFAATPAASTQSRLTIAGGAASIAAIGSKYVSR